MSDFSGYYYYQVCSTALGPYTFDELMARIQGGDVTSSTKVWREDVNQWSALDAYPEFQLAGVLEFTF